MTLQEAYRVLRRYEDFRIGFDHRCVCDAHFREPLDNNSMTLEG